MSALRRKPGRGRFIVLEGLDGAGTTTQAERIATANNLTVERYLRVVTSGTFSSVSFAVVIVRNDTAVVF